MLPKIIGFFVPQFYKKKKLLALFELTANAFEAGMPELEKMDFNQCLHKYALFTKEQAILYLKSGYSVEVVKHRLHQNAFLLAVSLRQSFHIRSRHSMLFLLSIIYNMIGIDLHYNKKSEWLITECFFQKYYSPEICMLLSSMDEGLAEGLSGGGKLRFEKRLTEGHRCCKAILSGGA